MGTDSAATPRTGLARAVFFVACRSQTGVLAVRAGAQVTRIEFEQGYVQALSNAGPRLGSPDETLRRFLDERARAEAAGDEHEFTARPARSPLYGVRIQPFHPARAVRLHLEAKLAAEPAPPLPVETRLVLELAPHASCLERDEQLVVSLLGTPRRIAELTPVLAPARLFGLVAFLDAVGALRVEDLATSEAFERLGLAPGAPAADVRQAYRRLAQAAHPDRFPGASPEEVRALEERFHILTSAYRLALGSAGGAASGIIDGGSG